MQIFSKFQQLLCEKYNNIVAKSDVKNKLINYIKKSGILLKNDEWINSTVIDLSTMPQNEIVITNSSNGSDFSTNIKTLESNSLLYGSIRPYFRKCGFAVDEKYVTGTVHSFNVKNNDYYLWILATICSDDFHKYTEINSQGTKMPIINWDTFGNYEITIPNSNELDMFNKAMRPFYSLVLTKMRENKKLKQLKSQLLQKYFG